MDHALNSVTTGIHIVVPGASGTQFGKGIFSTVIPFKAVETFLTVFDNVQRKLERDRVRSIARYILSGLATENSYCFLSAVTATCRGPIGYDQQTHTVTIDINSKLSINDGQHRVEGIKLALKDLRLRLSKENNPEKINELFKRLERLENMTIPLVIFSQMSEDQERQLFHDLNLLATKPNKSISLNFDSSNLYNRMAKELKDENGFLVKYGVDVEKTQLRQNNKNLMLLSTLRNTITYIITGTANEESDMLNTENYDLHKKIVNEVLNDVFQSLPKDCNNRSKYIIGTAVTLQAIGKFVHFLTKEGVDRKTTLKKLSKVNWSHKNRIWNDFGGKIDENKGHCVFSGTATGVNGIYRYLCEHMM